MTVKDHSATTAASKKTSIDDTEGVSNVGLMRKQRIDQKQKADFRHAEMILNKRRERLSSQGQGRMT